MKKLLVISGILIVCRLLADLVNPDDPSVVLISFLLCFYLSDSWDRDVEPKS